MAIDTSFGTNFTPAASAQGPTPEPAQDAPQSGLDTLAGAPPTLDQQLPNMGASAAAAAQDEIPPFPQPKPAAPAGPAPGSFGWKLANTLKGLQLGLAGMGDAAAVGTVSSGAGWVQGMSRTMEAANERKRVEQERQDKLAQEQRENTREDWKSMAAVANANAQMRHEQLLTSKLGEEARDASIANGQQMVNSWTTASKFPVQPLLTHTTASQLTSLLGQKDNDGKPKLNPAEVTAFPDGKVMVGEDRNGVPQYATTYSVLPVPKEHVLTEADRDWVNTLNKRTGSNWSLPEGQAGEINYKSGDKMPGYVANSLYQESQNINAYDTAVEQATNEKVAANEAAGFVRDGIMAKYLGETAVNGKPSIPAAFGSFMRDWSQPNSPLKAKYPNPIQDMYRSLDTADENGKPKPGTGEARYDTLDKEYTLQMQKADPLTKFQEDPKQFEGQASSSAVQVLKGLLQSDPMSGGNQPTGPRRSAIQSQLSIANEAYKQWQQDEQNKLRYAEELKTGDPVELGKYLGRGDLTWEQMKTRSLTAADMPKMLAAAQAEYNLTHPNSPAKFSEAQMSEWQKLADSSANNPFFSGANSLLAKGGTIDQLQAIRKQIPNFQPPVFNTVGDLYQAQSGDNPALSQYATAVIGLAQDYSRVESGGTATVPITQEALERLKPALYSKNLDAALTGIRNSVRSQRDAWVGNNLFLEDRKRVGESVVPPGAQPGYDKNGKIIGYKDAEGRVYRF